MSRKRFLYPESATILASATGLRGVIHCFTGDAAHARAYVDLGFYVSFSGIVTFRKWAGDELVRMVPADRILAESDAPYLAPVPNRSKRNEPAWVRHTAEMIAKVRGVTLDELAAQTTSNALRLFSLK